MLLGTLGASLLGIMLIGKGVIRTGEGELATSWAELVKIFNAASFFENYANLFTLNEHERNHKIILKHFQYFKTKNTFYK